MILQLFTSSFIDVHSQEFQNDASVGYSEYASSYNEGYGSRKGGQKFIIKLYQSYKWYSPNAQAFHHQIFDPLPLYFFLIFLNSVNISYSFKYIAPYISNQNISWNTFIRRHSPNEELWLRWVMGEKGKKITYYVGINEHWAHYLHFPIKSSGSPWKGYANISM